MNLHKTQFNFGIQVETASERLGVRERAFTMWE